VVLYTGGVTAERLEKWCRSNIPSSLRPRRYIQVTALPRNAMGDLAGLLVATMWYWRLKTAAKCSDCALWIQDTKKGMD